MLMDHSGTGVHVAPGHRGSDRAQMRPCEQCAEGGAGKGAYRFRSCSHKIESSSLVNVARSAAHSAAQGRRISTGNARAHRARATGGEGGPGGHAGGAQGSRRRPRAAITPGQHQGNQPSTSSGRAIGIVVPVSLASATTWWWQRGDDDVCVYVFMCVRAQVGPRVTGKPAAARRAALVGARAGHGRASDQRCGVPRGSRTSSRSLTRPSAFSGLLFLRSLGLTLDLSPRGFGIAGGFFGFLAMSAVQAQMRGAARRHRER